MAKSFDYQEKPIAQLLTEFRDELKEFAAIRIAMARAEIRDKLKQLARAVPAIAGGAIVALIAALFLTVALVALIAMAFGGGAGAWAASFAIVGVLFALTGALAISYGVKKLKARNLKPERTLRILKQDEVWLRDEVRNRK